MYNSNHPSRQSLDKSTEQLIAPSAFAALPEEIILQILLLLNINAIVYLSRVDRRFKAIIATYFILPKDPKRYLNWQAIFSQQPLKIYGEYSSEVKELYQLIVANNLQGFKDFFHECSKIIGQSGVLAYLCEQNTYNNKSLLSLAKALKRQDFLGYIYNIVCSYIANQQEEINNYPLSYWAKQCQQTSNQGKDHFHSTIENVELVLDQLSHNGYDKMLSWLANHLGTTHAEMLPEAIQLAIKDAQKPMSQFVLLPNLIQKLSNQQLEELVALAQEKYAANFIVQILQIIYFNAFLRQGEAEPHLPIYDALLANAMAKWRFGFARKIMNWDPRLRLSNNYIATGGITRQHELLLLALAEGPKSVADYVLEDYPADKLIELNRARLTTAGVNTHQQDEAKTALCFAIEQNFEDTAQALIAKGAAVKADAGQMQPIHLAVRAGRLNMIRTLLNHNAEILLLRDSHGRSPLHLALIYDNRHVAAYLAQQYLIRFLQSKKKLRRKATDINNVVNDLDRAHVGKTVLYLAAERGYAEIVTDLLHAGAKVKLDKGVGAAELQPIHIAAQNGHIQVIALLYTYQPEQIMLVDKNNWTPLMHAAESKQWPTVDYILRNCDLNLEANSYKGKGLSQVTEARLALKLSIAKRNESLTKEDELVSASNSTSTSLAPANPPENPNNTKTIFQAAREGDLERLVWLIEVEKIDVNQRDIIGRTPLHLAAKFANLETVRYLVEYGADPLLKCNLQNTVLEIVTFQHENSPEMQKQKLEYLLAQGYQFENALFALAYEGGENSLSEMTQAQLLQKDRLGRNLIHFASSIGDLKLLQFIMEKFFFNNLFKSKDGNPPLLFAADNGYLEVIKWLLREGKANINEKNKNGDTALLRAAWRGHLEVVKWLLQEGGANINGKNEYGNTALLRAARDNHWDMVKWLVQEGGANINEKNRYGDTALLYAVRDDRWDMVEWLVKKGAATNINEKRYGKTALLRAAEEGHLGVVKWLLQEGGANINEKDDIFGDTALLRAAREGHLGVVKWLLQEGGANINEKNKNGNTALLCAADNGHLEVIKWLVREGRANISEKNNDGNTALLYAADNGHLEVIKWLVREGRANINEKNGFGDTALLYAALHGHWDMVKWLVQEGGANINEKNQYGDTALLYAASDDRWDMVRWLVREGGANINEKNQYGDTALLYAAHRGHWDMVKWLVQEGGATNINEKDRYGITVLLYAADGSHWDMVEWLVQEGGECLEINQENPQTAKLNLTSVPNHLFNSIFDSICQHVSFLKITKLTVENSQQLSEQQKKQLSDTIYKNSLKSRGCAHSLRELALFTLWSQPNAKLEKRTAQFSRLSYKFSFTDKQNHPRCEFHFGQPEYDILLQGQDKFATECKFNREDSNCLAM